MADPVDRRLTPVRDDLAADFLRGTVEAPRFAPGTPMEVTAGVAPIMRMPAAIAPRETELLFGEPFTVYEVDGGWAWGQSGNDGYVGYVAAGSLSAPTGQKAIRITALRTLIFSQPDIKSAPFGFVSMNALATNEQDAKTTQDFVPITLADGSTGYLVSNHCAAIHETSPDFVAEAEKYLYTPYLWGGRSSLGLDCSALVQNAIMRAQAVTADDKPVLRDTDMQELSLGTQVSTNLEVSLKRGDLIFWKGHVGIMVDADIMIHANGTYMMVTRNNVRDFATMVEGSTGPVTSVRRIA